MLAPRVERKSLAVLKCSFLNCLTWPRRSGTPHAGRKRAETLTRVSYSKCRACRVGMLAGTSKPAAGPDPDPEQGRSAESQSSVQVPPCALPPARGAQPLPGGAGALPAHHAVSRGWIEWKVSMETRNWRGERGRQSPNISEELCSEFTRRGKRRRWRTTQARTWRLMKGRRQNQIAWL